jgi:hypothetical protein
VTRESKYSSFFLFVPDARLKRITAWLNTRPDVSSWKTGKAFDIWHGNFKDTEEAIEQAATGAAKMPRA